MKQKPDTKTRITTGLLAIFLGALGVHKFKLGYRKQGFQQLTLLDRAITPGIFFKESLKTLIQNVA